MTETTLWQGALVAGLVGIVTLAGVVTGDWSALVVVPGVVVALVLTRRVPGNSTGWWLLVGAVSGTLAWVLGTLGETEQLSVVVALLAAVFVAGAVWLPSLLPFEESSLAVAASTLAVFFLFNPLRVRVQRMVDRRFYRSRYDARQVADEFTAKLRDQVDPDAVAWEWVEVVQRTLQPAAVSVWVREEMP